MLVYIWTSVITPYLFAAEEITVTTSYPAPFGDYDYVAANTKELYNTLSNPNPSLSTHTSTNDFRYVNVNVGLRIFDGVVGSYSTTYTDANAATATTNLDYIEFDATTPAMTFKDSTGTIVFELASGELAIKTGTTERIRIDTAGQVGIGTNNPDVDLYINGKLKVHDGITGIPSNGINGGNGTRLVLWPGKGTQPPYALGIASGTLWYGTPSAARHAWYTGTTELMRLDNSGSLVISGANPTVYVRYNNDGGKQIRMHNGNGTTYFDYYGGDANFRNNGGTTVLRLSDGNAVDVRGGNFHINGSLPIQLRRYRNLGHNGTLYTGYHNTSWVAALVGFLAEDFDVNEGGGDHNLRCYLLLNGTQWTIRYDFPDHGDYASWHIDVLYIKKEMAQVVDDFTYM